MTADVFSAMPHDDRKSFVPDYMNFLRESEGKPNLVTKTLPRREAFFRDLKPIALEKPLVDPDLFARNVTARKPEKGLDRRMLWALSVAKANRAERYGIDFKLRVKGFEKDGIDDPYTFVELQELYHTKIFISILKTIGLEADILPPNGMTRMIVMGAGGLPHAMSDVIALAAEVAGVAAFRLLREEAGKLFDGEIRARIELLFTQILKDEVGHVRFLRSRLGRVRLAIARTLLPLVTRGMLDDLPEMVELLGRERFLAEVARANLET